MVFVFPTLVAIASKPRSLAVLYHTLMSALKPGIIDPAVEMRNKLRLIKAQEHPTESLRDYLDKSL